MVVDCHIHDRDEEEDYKETIRHALEVSRDSGVDGHFAMPNPKRPILDRQRVLDRLALADAAGVPEVFYGTYMGLTDDPEQVKEAVATYRELFPRVVGFKLYAGHSIGRLGVIGVHKQIIPYGILVREGYNGVLAVHAEKEEVMIPNAWNSNLPVSHCLARPEACEIESVRDQIMIAEMTGFKGKLHISHISSPSAVDLVVESRRRGLDISCGVCPHHFIYDWTRMYDSDGILFKMNPALRKPGDSRILLEDLRNGKIDLVETDHAPHSLEEKTAHPFLSGIVSLPWWEMFKEYLRRYNFTEPQIEDVTHNNVCRRFGINIKRGNRLILDRRGDYPINHWENIEKELGWSP